MNDTKDNAVVVGIADASQPQERFPRETIQLLYIFQTHYKGNADYQNKLLSFEQDLLKNNIPWSFDNHRFVAKFNTLGLELEQLLLEIKRVEGLPMDEANAQVQQEMNSYVPKEIVDPLIEELQQSEERIARLSDEYIHNLTKTYIQNLKRRGIDVEVKQLQTILGSEVGLILKDTHFTPIQAEQQIAQNLETVVAPLILSTTSTKGESTQKPDLTTTPEEVVGAPFKPSIVSQATQNIEDSTTPTRPTPTTQQGPEGRTQPQPIEQGTLVGQGPLGQRPESIQREKPGVTTISAIPLTPEIKLAIHEAAVSTVQQMSDATTPIVAAHRMIEAMPRILLDTETKDKLTVFRDLLVLSIEQPEKTTAELLPHAAQLSRSREALATAIPEGMDITKGPDGNVHFARLSLDSTVNPFGVVSDVLAGQFDLETRNQMVEEVLKIAIVKKVSKEGIDRMVEQYGEDVVRAEFFQQAVVAAQKLPDKKEVRTPKTLKEKQVIERSQRAADEAVGGYFDLVAHEVKTAKLPGVPEIIKPSKQQAVQGFIDTIQHGATHLTHQGEVFQYGIFQIYLLLRAQHPNISFRSIALDEAKSRLIHWGIEKGATLVGKKVAGVAAKRGLQGLITTLFGGAGTFLGGPIGTVVLGAIGFVATEIIGRAFKFFGKITSFAAGGWIQRVLRGGEGKKGFNIDQNFSGVMAAFLVGMLALLTIGSSIPIFSEFLSNINYNTLLGTLDPNLYKGGGQPAGPPGTVGGGLGTVPLPPDAPVPPVSTVIGCPVNNGSITQGPSGAFSHTHLDAYDINATFGSEVRATHPGTVTRVVRGFRPGTGPDVAGLLGNYVVIAGTSIGGQQYETRYAHLTSIPSNLTEGTVIAPNASNQFPVIGLVDSTGNTTGPHLHYEYRGPGTLELPAGCAGH